MVLSPLPLFRIQSERDFVNQLPFETMIASLIARIQSSCNNDSNENVVSSTNSISKFTDSKQEQMNNWMITLDTDVANNVNDYNHYDQTTGPNLCQLVTETNDILRLVQSMLLHMGLKAHDKIDVEAGWMIWYVSLLRRNENISFPNVQSMLELIQLFQKQCDHTEDDITMTRNICIVTSIMSQQYDSFEWKKANTAKLVSYIQNAVNHYHEQRSQLFALTCLEQLTSLSPVKIRVLQFNRFQDTLHQLARTADNFKIENLYNRGMDYYLRFQIGSISKLLLENMFGTNLSVNKNFNPIQLRTSSDTKKKVNAESLCAYGCFYSWQDYQSTVGVDVSNGGIYYYEIILLTSGSIRIGWTTALQETFGTYGFGGSEHSIMFDPYEKRVKSVGTESQYIQDLPTASPCDIVGCLLDTKHKKFKFYLNGIEVQHKWCYERIESFPSRTMYPTVSLSGYQQVCFNFGQHPFRFKPTNFAICTLYEQHHKLNLVYNDDRQKNIFDKFIIDLDCKVSIHVPDQDYLHVVMRDRFVDYLVTDNDSWLRMIQAIVIEMGGIAEDKIDVFGFWIIYYMSRVKVNIPPIEMIIDTLRPIMEAQTTSTTISYFRNVCILLSILPQLYDWSINPNDSFSDDLIKFIAKMVVDTSESLNSLKLYALLCMQNFSACSPFFKKCFLEHFELENAIKNESYKIRQPSKNNELQLETVTSTPWDSVSYQLCNLSINILEQVYEHRIYQEDESCLLKFRSNSSQQSHTIAKMSPAGLSPMTTCCGWLEFQPIVPLTHGNIYYYEALPLTCGQFQLGWSQTSEPIQVSMSGTTFYENGSFLFDVHEKRFYESGYVVKYFPKMKSPGPGDVIGCLLNTRNKTYNFFLNGFPIVPKPLELKSDSSKPFFATFGVAAFQQAFFNFGQAPFCYPPKVNRLCNITEQI